MIFFFRNHLVKNKKIVDPNFCSSFDLINLMKHFSPPLCFLFLDLIWFFRKKKAGLAIFGYLLWFSVFGNMQFNRLLVLCSYGFEAFIMEISSLICIWCLCNFGVSFWSHVCAYIWDQYFIFILYWCEWIEALMVSIMQLFVPRIWHDHLSFMFFKKKKNCFWLFI